MKVDWGYDQTGNAIITIFPETPEEAMFTDRQTPKRLIEIGEYIPIDNKQYNGIKLNLGKDRI